MHKIIGGVGSNAFLIEDKKNVLIDAGTDAKRVISILKGMKRGVDEIVLTHSHIDHTLALPEILKSLKSSAEVAIHEAEFYLIGDEKVTASHLFGVDPPSIEPGVCLKDGDLLNTGSIVLKVIHTPGHSPGSISLYEKEGENLFCGDTVFPSGNFGRTDLYGGDSKKLIESIKKLSRLEVENMYPGHMNCVFGNAKKSIELSLRYAETLL